MKFYYARNEAGQCLNKDFLWIDKFDSDNCLLFPTEAALRTHLKNNNVGNFNVHDISPEALASLNGAKHFRENVIFPQVKKEVEQQLIGTLKGIDPKRMPDFSAALAKLAKEYKMAFQPHADYSVVGDLLTVYLEDEQAVAKQITPNITILNSLHSQAKIVGVKIVGMLELLSPATDPSVKAMMVPLDVAVAALERYDQTRMEGSDLPELAAEEVQFVQMCDHHWPTLWERFPWIRAVLPTPVPR